ncbi:lipocalin-like domain-containing protein [Hirsutella rhossiliensis]|uniref:Lipocalin-like domain-containing protein n=1 Tax=Hirsutella rhossiliensis TaxID=111463 RepID=A0A9P8N808_9HYPO|nr:lipocalin-like domain-containing protein [Hirsutella rhossiliensis]KAH0966312.1 lipocalin-like domain-containing protein [Hirsutella rhossiliensis]
MRASALLGFSALALANAAAIRPAAPKPHAVPATWDGKCWYPTADSGFQLESYLLGRWYQVAGTLVPFTAGCRCISAQYTLNANGTVRVDNSCENRGKFESILGTAAPADATYGADGVFRVQFPGRPASKCPGPNYIVQDYTGDIAIVQSSNFSTLFILSRKQHLEDKVIDAWIQRAGLLGSDLTKVKKTDQSNCSPK